MYPSSIGDPRRHKLTLLALCSIGLLVIGQTMLKYGLGQVGGVHFVGGDLRTNLQRLLSTPYVTLGLLFYGIAAVLWLDVLSVMEFSRAFPMVALTYVFSLVIGSVLFQETVTIWRVLGVALIVLGVGLVARS
jgi:drug/metabolite transporter (DMT)-like permease